jgi:hypothetical protein
LIYRCLQQRQTLLLEIERYMLNDKPRCVRPILANKRDAGPSVSLDYVSDPGGVLGIDLLHPIGILGAGFPDLLIARHSLEKFGSEFHVHKSV